MTDAWWSQVVSSASCDPRVGWTRRITRRTCWACPLPLAKTVKAVSADNNTSGADSQYEIGCHAWSGMASIAARTRLSSGR